MEIFQKYKNIFLFVGIFVAVILIYVLFFSGSGSATNSPSTNPAGGGLVSELSVSPADVAGGRELLAVLTELQSISLNGSIFTDPVFVSLKDWSMPLESQPFAKALGRRNPFSEPAR